MGTKSKDKGKDGQKPGKKGGGEPASSSKIAAAKPSSSLPADPGPEPPRRTSGKMKAAKPAEAKPAEEPELVEGDEDDEDRPKRALGLRGAAPWAARHAAKHAAEARKRAAEPPPPGSARATIRTPSDIEEIKVRIAELHNNVERIKTLRKTLARTFYDIGLILHEIQNQKLFSAKGYQSFEAFVEREVDLGKSASLRLMRLVATYTREEALSMGYDRALDALAQLEGIDVQTGSTSDSKLPIAKPAMPASATRGPIVGR